MMGILEFSPVCKMVTMGTHDSLSSKMLWETFCRSFYHNLSSINTQSLTILPLLYRKVIRGNRNKGTITRTTDFGRSPMSDIFGGKLRSRVHREGDHPTDNIQPFFTLQLDIEVSR